MPSRIEELRGVKERWAGRELPECPACGGQLQWFCGAPDDEDMCCAIIVCENSEDGDGESEECGAEWLTVAELEAL